MGGQVKLVVGKVKNKLNVRAIGTMTPDGIVWMGRGGGQGGGGGEGPGKLGSSDRGHDRMTIGTTAISITAQLPFLLCAVPANTVTAAYNGKV